MHLFVSCGYLDENCKVKFNLGHYRPGCPVGFGTQYVTEILSIQFNWTENILIRLLCWSIPIVHQYFDALPTLWTMRSEIHLQSIKTDGDKSILIQVYLELKKCEDAVRFYHS